MAGRGFRGKEARIKFSADVSALERVKGTLGRLFSFIGNQSIQAAKKAQAIENAMERVAKKEAAWQRVVSEGINVAERRAMALARADEQITRAKDRLTAITNKQLQLAGTQSVQYLRTADRVAKAEESVLRAKEAGFRISEKQAAQLRNLQKFQDNLDKAKIRGATRENRIENRRDEALANYGRLGERAIQSRQRFANSSARIANTILSAEERVEERRRSLNRLDLDRQTEAARESERIASKRVNLAQNTAKLLEEFAPKTSSGSKNSANNVNVISRNVASEKGLVNLISRLEGVRDSVRAAKNEVAALEFEKQIAGAQHLLNITRQYGRFTQDTEEKRQTANNALLRSQRDLENLQNQRTSNERNSEKSVAAYNARLTESANKVGRLNKELETTKDNNAKAAAEGKKQAEDLKATYASQISSLERLQAARGEAAARYLRLEKAQQYQAAVSQKTELDRIDKEIVAQNRKIDLTQRAYNSLKKQNTQRSKDQIQQEALAAQGIAKEQSALDRLLQSQQQITNSQAAASSKFLGSVGQVLSELGASKVAMLALGAAGVTAFGLAQVQAIKLGIKLQTLRATYKGLTGDLSQAQQIIDESFGISQKLPVDPSQLLEGARTLLAVGAKVQTLSQDLKALSVIATVANQPMAELSVIYGEILTKNRLYREDLLQFSRRGIPLMQALSRLTGKSRDELDELVSLGGVKFDTFQAALRSLGAENSKYGATVSEMVNTVQGQLTLMSSEYSHLLKSQSEFLEQAGLYSAFTDVVSGLRRSVRSLAEAGEFWTRVLRDWNGESELIVRNGVGGFDRLSESIRRMDPNKLEGTRRALAALENAFSNIEETGDWGMLDYLTKGFSKDFNGEWKDLLETAKALGIEIKQFDLGTPDGIKKFRAQIEQIRITLDAIRAPGANITLPGVAELKAREEAIKNINKYLEEALTPEQRMAIAIKETNDEFDRRATAIKEAIANGEPGNREQLGKDLVKTENERKIALEGIGKERAKEVLQMMEEAKLAQEIAGWVNSFKAGKGINLGEAGNIFGIPEEAQQAVAAYLVKVAAVRKVEEALGHAHAFTNAEIRKHIELLIEQAGAGVGGEKIKELEDEVKLRGFVLTYLAAGVKLQEAEAQAALELMLAKKQITQAEFDALSAETKKLFGLNKEVDAQERIKKLVEDIKNKRNPELGLKEQFEDVLRGVNEFGLGLQDAKLHMQDLLLTALGLQNAMEFKSSKISLGDTGQRIQELALSQGAAKQTEILREISGILDKIAQGLQGDDLTNAIKDAIKVLRNLNGRAGA